MFSLFWIAFVCLFFFFIMPFVFISFVLSVGLFYFNMLRFVSIVFCNFLLFWYVNFLVFNFDSHYMNWWHQKLLNHFNPVSFQFENNETFNRRKKRHVFKYILINPTCYVLVLNSFEWIYAVKLRLSAPLEQALSRKRKVEISECPLSTPKLEYGLTLE